MPGPAPAAGPVDPQEALNAVWYTVAKPAVIVVAGAPGIEPVWAGPTLAEATAVVSRIPGGMIILQAVVFVNPQRAPILAPKPQ